ncbi:transcription-repair coupling factor [Candidatus Nucleicultrix amoebiphila]|jgi:transcription-repair coupling factor (superfamily II helicase)|uniref:transcription-repair coupling factor n=1 Tax=Candidatus Nucleicultrix amoebiphila TaxID=1509244 RepID=UPI000A26E501|nr:transcription-repair coupling factor [Candidatus Nucleicultrix amoebiphila]
MDLFHFDLPVQSKSEPITVINCPSDLEPFLLGYSPFKERFLVYVSLDDSDLFDRAQLFRFIDPQRPVLLFPTWDTLPYDRISPRQDIIGERSATLSLLEQGVAPNTIIMTSLAAILQRIPPQENFQGFGLTLHKGKNISRQELTMRLEAQGYHRVEIVREPSEYALRGNLVDVFPAHSLHPYRLDFFGDELETLKAFDPLSQRSAGEEAELKLLPSKELSLTPQTIARFRQGYRATFLDTTDQDPLYESVSAGRPYPGMEQWLPLFYSKLSTLQDYLPADALWCFDAHFNEAALARFEQIQEHYQARKAYLKESKKLGDGFIYHPLPPEQLYLSAKEFEDLTKKNSTIEFHSFQTQASSEENILDCQARRAKDFHLERNSPDINVFEALKEHIQSLQNLGDKVLITAPSFGAISRLETALKDHGFISTRQINDLKSLEDVPHTILGLCVLPLDHGFSLGGFSVLTEQDILGDKQTKTTKRRRRSDLFLGEASNLTTGDYVVHMDHGIGQYTGLMTLTINDLPHDCLALIYEGGDKLFVPVENIEVLSRYGGEDSFVVLDRLGSASWQARKARVKKNLLEMASGLIKIAAERQLENAESYKIEPGQFNEFCARFPYTETEDQLIALDETLEDLSAGKPMDRLICGDVGFGKTEIAIRAAFVVASQGKQVAIIAPTTLLARQHYQNFQRRFQGFGLKVAQLSRFTTPKDASLIKEGIKDGTIQVVIGTHSLLGKGIHFLNLGLMIVDEEQHFGVKQKEHLKSLQANVHVLTLTATPIPRTLQMALTGVRDMSIIATPPVDRLAVRTFVMPFDGVMIREAILREKYRGGQIFYVTPRIEFLEKIQLQLQELVPEIKVAMAHGQLPPRALEKTMLDFCDGRYDLLLATNIIESGLDIPTVNTIIVDRADLFGLAQLYQIRGRVGRTKIRAYAYLLLPPTALSTTSQKRLEIMQTLDNLGAGFQLASHDMDIRGAGNLLGDQQSGHIREVGIELYQQMLEEAVEEARNRQGNKAAEPAVDHWTPQLNLGLPVLIPEHYVHDLTVRLHLYQRLVHLNAPAEIEDFAIELIDRFGPLPLEVTYLLEIIYLKTLCRAANIDKVDIGDKGIVLGFYKNSFPNPEGLITMIQNSQGTIRLRPDQKLVYIHTWSDIDQRLKGIKTILEELKSLAEKKSF